MLIDSALPRWDFREVHTLTVAAPPEVVWQALQSLTPHDIPVARFLMAMRSWPMRALGRASLDSKRPETLLDSMADKFVPLGEIAGAETVSGAAGQWWKPTAPFVRLESPEQFREFSSPGYLKAAITFRAVSRGQHTLLGTETRVIALDRRTRNLFRPYWHLLVHPFGGVIRKAWLRAIAARATAMMREAPAQQRPPRD